MVVRLTQHQETLEMLIRRANKAKRRIELLASDPHVRQAFQIANRKTATAARQRSPDRYLKRVPAWRLFQLAFLLSNVESLADPTSDQRSNADLLFFPSVRCRRRKPTSELPFRDRREHGLPKGTGVELQPRMQPAQSALRKAAAAQASSLTLRRWSQLNGLKCTERPGDGDPQLHARQLLACVSRP
jgi:hypothetical protein